MILKITSLVTALTQEGAVHAMEVERLDGVQETLRISADIHDALVELVSRQVRVEPVLRRKTTNQMFQPAPPDTQWDLGSQESSEPFNIGEALQSGVLGVRQL